MLDEAESGSFSLYRVILPEELVFGQQIGSGTEASVYSATWGNYPVAVKKFRGIPSSSQFQRELSIMSLIQHPNLVQCYGGFSDTKTDTYYLVMDLMDSDVSSFLHKPQDSNTSSQYEFSTILKIAQQTAKGLEYLHQLNLIHRDLKSVNLLIDSQFNVKVGDFGLSRMIAPKNKNMTANIGTVSWIAPEVFEKQPYDAKADVYSFGIVLWELFTKKVPFENIDTFDIPIAVIKGERPVIPKECPKEYSKLIQLCWNKKPNKRPTFSKIYKTLVKISKDLGLQVHSADTSFIANSLPLFLRFNNRKAFSTDNLTESTNNSSSKSEEEEAKAKLNEHSTASPKFKNALKTSVSSSIFPKRRGSESKSIKKNQNT